VFNPVTGMGFNLAANTLVFNASDVANSTANVTSVGGITTTAGFTGKITIKQSGVPEPALTTSSLTLGGGTIQGDEFYGYQGGSRQATVTVAGLSSTFAWTGGKLSNLVLNLGDDDGPDASTNPTAKQRCQEPILAILLVPDTFVLLYDAIFRV
jgi:hypothetical protein